MCAYGQFEDRREEAKQMICYCVSCCKYMRTLLLIIMNYLSKTSTYSNSTARDSCTARDRLQYAQETWPSPQIFGPGYAGFLRG